MPDQVVVSAPRRTVFKVIAVFLVVIALGLAGYKYFIQDSQRRVTTTGMATKVVTPEKAVITFTLSIEGATRELVIAEGESKLAEVMAVVDSFSPSSVTKNDYSVVPRTNRINAETSGFQYIVGAEVTLDSVERVSALLGQLYLKDVTLAQVRYLPKDAAAVEKEVREMAVQNARERAQQMAQASNARLGKVITVAENNAQAGTSILVQGTAPSVQLRSTVTVIFELR